MSEQKPEHKVAQLMLQHKLTLVTAESCTGGLIGHLLTNVPGSSQYFLGGLVTYADEMKHSLIAVRAGTLEEHGAVSAEVAKEMAYGVRLNLIGDIGLSVTGIAGPGGATEGKPVGLTYVGISTPDVHEAYEFRWDGDREANKLASARAAIQVLLDHLESLAN
jgi:PncC family amidohydrolase